MHRDVFTTSSEDETMELGRTLAQQLAPGVPVLLIGNLGAGKTTLAKGIIDGLGLASPEEVASPTFTLIHEYGERAGRVYHIDLYRLDTPAQVATLGLDEILDQDAIVLVEWGERFPELWPAGRVEIRLTTESGEQRRIEVTKT
jgi:tRNA threonylcarbamoyladenosine biosynthesis protein TsaE